MKKQVMILLVLTIFFCTLLPAQAANLPPITGVQFFPADHIWNVRVDTLPVDPKSNMYINAANSSAYLYMHRGFFYNIVDSSTPKQYMTSIRYAAVSDNVPVPIPKGALVETASSDHQMDIVDKDSKKYYQIFDAHQAADGTWSCGSLAVFDLTGYTLRPDGWSADEAGLPGLPGTLRYDEVASGEINHALRVGLWRTQNAHIWPARFHSGLGDTTFPPMGQRFRLKASVDISKYTPQQQVILKALKKYGMMVATNTGQKNIWALAAITDSRWDTNYASFSGIKASDFEAVDVSSLMINKDSGKSPDNHRPHTCSHTYPVIHFLDYSHLTERRGVVAAGYFPYGHLGLYRELGFDGENYGIKSRYRSRDHCGKCSPGQQRKRFLFMDCIIHRVDGQRLQGQRSEHKQTHGQRPEQ